MNGTLLTNWWDDLPQSDETYVDGSGWRGGRLVVDGIIYTPWTMGTYASNSPMIELFYFCEGDCHACQTHGIPE